MPYTTEKITAIVHDLKSSWYFRAWLSAWFGFSILFLACFIILGAQSATNEIYKDMKFYYENASQIAFPRYHFRTSGGQTIKSVYCSFGAQNVQTGGCTQMSGQILDKAHCVAVEGESFSVLQTNTGSTSDISIICTVTTEGTDAGSVYVNWEIDGSNEGYIGPQAGAPLLISPTNNTWVLISKMVTKPQGQQEIVSWEPDLIVHSNAHPSEDTYVIYTVINSFKVNHYEFTDVYNGWMMLGDVGGYAYFLLILHTLVMMVVGLCLDKKSHYLV